MRTAFVSLIALAGLASTAVAQPAETPPAQPPAPPTAAAPAPPAAAPPATTPPLAPEAPAAAPAEQPLPQRPTSGDGAVVLDIIERVCVPLVRGGNQEQLARAYGFRKQRDRFSMTLGAKPYMVFLEPQRSDKNTCELTIEHKVDGDEEIAKALHTWAFLHQPELKPYRSDIRPEPATGNQLTTRSWEHFTHTDSIGLVFVKQRKADGTPLGRNADRSKVLYQERKLTGGS